MCCYGTLGCAVSADMPALTFAESQMDKRTNSCDKTKRCAPASVKFCSCVRGMVRAGASIILHVASPFFFLFHTTAVAVFPLPIGRNDLMPGDEISI